jgi:predicted phosphodiesterase
LDDIKEQKCEKLFVLGDYAMAGPEPKEIVDYFMDRKLDSDINMIQGNTDLMIADYSDNLYESLKEKAPVMAEALTNDVSMLDEKEKEFLKHLPAQKEVLVEGVKFLLVHGSPRRNNEDILPDLPSERVEEMLEGVDAQVVLCGHTHIPCGYQTGKKQTVVNAGSVGRPFTPEPKSCYLVITVKDGKYIFEHRFVEYDKEKASEKLRKRTFDGAEKLAQTLLNPQQRHF